MEQGLRGCVIAGIKKRVLAEAFDLPDHLEVLLVLALGEPGEEVWIEPIGVDGDVKYWRSPDGVHHVPKRSLDEIITNWFNILEMGLPTGTSAGIIGFLVGIMKLYASDTKKSGTNGRCKEQATFVFYFCGGFLIDEYYSIN